MLSNTSHHRYEGGTDLVFSLLCVVSELVHNGYHRGNRVASSISHEQPRRQTRPLDRARDVWIGVLLENHAGLGGGTGGFFFGNDIAIGDCRCLEVHGRQLCFRNRQRRLLSGGRGSAGPPHDRGSSANQQKPGQHDSSRNRRPPIGTEIRLWVRAVPDSYDACHHFHTDLRNAR